MKMLRIFRPAILCLIGILFFSGADSSRYRYRPILMDYNKMVNSVDLKSPRDIIHPGKIYVWNKLLFVSDKYLGVHIFDNDNPSIPSNIGFIQIPGNVDIAFYGDYLYADNAIDLITIDISKIKEGTIDITNRKTNVFPELESPEDYIPWEFRKENRPEGTVIIGWELSY